MVKVGFLVEGGCERIILRSTAFQSYLINQGIEPVGDIIDMDGKGNLTQSNQRMKSQVQTLRDAGAEWIVVLRDLDEGESAEAIARVKEEVYGANDLTTCLAIQEIEAWFLADTNTLSVLFGKPFSCENPQQINQPADHLNAVRVEYTGRGIRDKKGFASSMVRNGFSIERAAEHPNCPSARYFLNTLQTLASAN